MFIRVFKKSYTPDRGKNRLGYGLSFPPHSLEECVVRTFNRAFLLHNIWASKSLN